MKKILSIVLMFASVISYAQNKNSFGFSLSTGRGFIMQEELVGAASQNLQQSFTAGFTYHRQLARIVKLETGLSYYSNSIDVTPAPNPSVERTTTSHPLRVVYVPVFVRLDVLKHFFINGGLIADLDVTKNSYINSQSGIGTGIGIGGEFNVSKKIAININPYMNFHGMFLTKSETYPERIVDSGIRLGVRTR